MKVQGSWLCPKGLALRDTWNALQRANGTSAMRMIPPSQIERDAARQFDDHVATCKECAK